MEEAMRRRCGGDVEEVRRRCGGGEAQLHTGELPAGCGTKDPHVTAASACCVRWCVCQRSR